MSSPTITWLGIPSSSVRVARRLALAQVVGGVVIAIAPLATLLPQMDIEAPRDGQPAARPAAQTAEPGAALLE